MLPTKLIRCLQPITLANCTSGALLLIRLIVGAAFIQHGWGKIQNPTVWMGPDSPVPGFFQFLAAVAEFGGGIALVLGLLTSLAALGLLITMAVAALTHMLVFKDPFVSATGGGSYELAAVYFSVSFLFLMVGPGKFSIDAKIFGHRQ